MPKSMALVQALPLMETQLAQLLSKHPLGLTRNEDSSGSSSEQAAACGVGASQTSTSGDTLALCQHKLQLPVGRPTGQRLNFHTAAADGRAQGSKLQRFAGLLCNAELSTLCYRRWMEAERPGVIGKFTSMR